MLSVCAPSLYTAACFLYTPALRPHLSQICHLSLLFLPLSLLHSSSLFSAVVFHPVSLIPLCCILRVMCVCGCMCVCPLVCMCGCLSGFVLRGCVVWCGVGVWCVCVCVIIARSPRGNQHWSLDSPDPLMPQHTCPWGAVPLSSACVCVCVAAPSVPPAWWRWSGHVASPTERSLHTHKHTHAQQRKPRGWGIKRWLINISDELQETNSREWKFIPTSLCTGPQWLASD